jgi:MYXO-CTERM domain-containing protein
VNVLVITGPYDGTDDDVRIALEEAFDAGIVTHVLAYGELAASPAPAFDDQLVAMADAGSGNTIGHLTATNADELSGALRIIVDALDLPCCATIDCSHVGGADSGGGDTDTDGADGGADWGGADGTAGDGSGSASASAGSDGSASASASATDTAGEIDDDGGCTCRSTATGPAWSWLLALLLLPRRRRRRG